MNSTLHRKITGRVSPPELVLRGPDDPAQLLPPALPRFKPGDALPGRTGWVLERHLSGGGFGEVWLARGVFGLERAVKFFHNLKDRHRDLLHEGNVIARLLRDGKHANVVPLLDASLDGDGPWLMYEYVEGGDLGDAIRRWAALPIAERQEKIVVALRLLANAVGRFHAFNPPIVHRDLKPANILYDRAVRQLRITDFGIGGVAAAELIGSERHGTLSRGARLQSHLFGACTPLYASPEQKRGEPPDPRDDVHALGVIAYQMLTGQMTHGVGPDFADDLAELGVAETLIDLVRRCTAKAQRRLKDAGVIVTVLDGASNLKSSGAPGERTTPTTAPPAAQSPLPEGIVVGCTECGVRILIPTKLLGKRVKCPKCSSVFAAKAMDGAIEPRSSSTLGVPTTSAAAQTQPQPTEIRPAQAPQELPDDLIASWERAGAEMCWLHRDGAFKINRCDSALPAFRFETWKAGVVSALAVPSTPFGLCLESMQVTDAGLKELASLKTLQLLVLYRTNVSDAGLEQLAGLRSLQTLYLDDTQLTDAGMRKLAVLENSQALSLRGTQVTNAGLNELAGLKGLRHLHLVRTQVTGAAAVAGLKSLEFLAVGGRQMTGAGLKELPGLKRLKALALDGVTDAGLKQLAGLKCLQYLHIRAANVTDVGLKDLAALEGLRGLDLRDTKVTDAGVATLQKALPDCRICRLC
ncbi:MAG: protein kinase [Gemmataceae bacterium]|nr:protein kinase [Gemmataceae bacterium]